MKQVFLFFGLSVLMGTITLFTLCGYDRVSVLHAAPVAAERLMRKRRLLKAAISVTVTNLLTKNGNTRDIHTRL